MSSTFISYLTLKEENTNLILRFLQHRLARVCTLRWANLDKIGHGSLKYKVQALSEGVEPLHGVAELLTLSRYALITLFIRKVS